MFHLFVVALATPGDARSAPLTWTGDRQHLQDLFLWWLADSGLDILSVQGGFVIEAVRQTMILSCPGSCRIRGIRRRRGIVNQQQRHVLTFCSTY